MSIEKAEATLPNGLRIVKDGEVIQSGEILVCYKGKAEWHYVEWLFDGLPACKSHERYYSIPVSPSRKEW